MCAPAARNCAAASASERGKGNILARTQTHRSVSRMTRRAAAQRRMRFVRLLCVISLGAALIVAYVWQRVWTHGVAQRIAEREREVRQLKAELAYLQETRARLADFERIRREAQERCGLVEQQKYVVPILSEFRSMVEEDRRESDAIK